MLSCLRRKLARCAAWRDIGATPDRSDDDTGADTGVTAPTREHPSPLNDQPVAGPGHPAKSLRVVLERCGSALLVHAGGSVDASNVVLWRRLVGEAAAVTAAPGPLIVETDGLEFMGVCAFAVLVEESASCRSRGVTLHLVSSQPVVSRIVTAAGLDTELSFSANLDEVIDGLPDQDPGTALGS